jgi:hypothetical protein
VFLNAIEKDVWTCAFAARKSIYHWEQPKPKRLTATLR